MPAELLRLSSTIPTTVSPHSTGLLLWKNAEDKCFRFDVVAFAVEAATMSYVSSSAAMKKTQRRARAVQWYPRFCSLCMIYHFIGHSSPFISSKEVAAIRAIFLALQAPATFYTSPTQHRTTYCLIFWYHQVCGPFHSSVSMPALWSKFAWIKSRKYSLLHQCGIVEIFFQIGSVILVCHCFPDFAPRLMQLAA